MHHKRWFGIAPIEVDAHRPRGMACHVPDNLANNELGGCDIITRLRKPLNEKADFFPQRRSALKVHVLASPAHT